MAFTQRNRRSHVGAAASASAILHPMSSPRPRIGLALGSGSARGWSHIGVIRALERAGHVPDIVCGTSIGALVGAVHAAGRLDWLEDWVRRLTWSGVVAMLDFRMGGGLIEGSRLTGFFRQHFRDEGIERLPLPFACVATELGTGREVWLREGPVIDAVRASIALPGLFTPTQLDDRLLVDGGLVNPVPVSLCRAMGADVVIAVDLNWDLIGRRARAEVQTEGSGADEAGAPSAATSPIAALLARLRAAARRGRPGAAGALDAGRADHQPEHHAGAHHPEPAGGRAGRRGDPAAPVGHRGHGLPPRRAGHRAGRGGGRAGAAAAGRRAGRAAGGLMSTPARTHCPCAGSPGGQPPQCPTPCRN